VTSAALTDILTSTRASLRAASKRKFAESMERFFKEPIRAYGVPSPQVKEIARTVYREIKSWPIAQRNRLMEEFWKSGISEEGAIVCYVYRRFSKQCAEAEFAMFEKWIDRHVKNWGHCDGVSSWLLAASIQNCPKLATKLPPWTKSRNRWKRRGAAVSLIQEAKQGCNTKTIFEVCGLLRDDTDDLVRKGVGWLLKETYPRRPREVLQFLDSWRTAAPRLVLRYAAEKMTAQDKRWLLKPS